MKPFKFIIFFLLIAFGVHAQGGFKIKFNTKNLKGNTIEMYFYGGSPAFAKRFDSTYIKTDNQIVEFSQKVNIIPLIAKVKLKKGNEFLNIDVENGENYQFTIDNGGIYSLKAVNSPLNSRFLDYQKKVFADANDKNNFVKKAITEFPNSAMALYFKIEDKRLAANPSDANAAAKFRNEYFSGFDKLDKRLKLLPNIYQYLYKGFTILPLNNENYQATADLLLDKVNNKSQMYAFYVSWIFKNLYGLRNRGLEKSYVDIYKKYLEKVDVKFENPSEGAMIINNAQISEKLANGTHIPEFEGVDTLNATHKLSEIFPKKKYTAIVFYDPECTHCQETLKGFNDLFARHPEFAQKVEKVAIINSIDKSKWRIFINKKSLQTWINLNNEDPKSTYQKDFMAYYNPGIFLINQNGVIIDKTGEVGFWEQIFTNY